MKIIDGKIEVKTSEKTGNKYLNIVAVLENGENIYLRTNNFDQQKYLMMLAEMYD